MHQNTFITKIITGTKQGLILNYMSYSKLIKYCNHADLIDLKTQHRS
jgi:hypothetical protein